MNWFQASLWDWSSVLIAGRHQGLLALTMMAGRSKWIKKWYKKFGTYFWCLQTTQTTQTGATVTLRYQTPSFHFLVAPNYGAIISAQGLCYAFSCGHAAPAQPQPAGPSSNGGCSHLHECKSYSSFVAPNRLLHAGSYRVSACCC